METNRLIARLCSLITLALLLASCSPKDEVTVYPLICSNHKGGSGYIKDGACDGEWITGNSFVYKVIPERQEIVHIGTFKNRYTDCVVTDVDNWKCTKNDGSGSFGFTDGQYWDDDPARIRRMKCVSKWRWWYVYLESTFRSK
jgi:hypothetical protein